MRVLIYFQTQLHQEESCGILHLAWVFSLCWYQLMAKSRIKCLEGWILPVCVHIIQHMQIMQTMQIMFNMSLNSRCSWWDQGCSWWDQALLFWFPQSTVYSSTRNRLSTSLATIICSRPSQVGQFRLFILMKRGTVLWFLARFSYWDDFRTSRSACSALLQSENTKIQNSIWQSLPPQFLPVLQKGHRNSIPATSQTFFFSAN